ncbi:hypothetical protein CLV63_112105 [Murinocardiopsis flavida]|uniref:Uncharacterized protein n=1 Tax=Murinocardiopsis flavida TaxID=645275 RepID=A0A2P8DG90_9ACTN|nr:hypothetical protein CLV63_112105 [Murinocardiopsis flavida]
MYCHRHWLHAARRHLARLQAPSTNRNAAFAAGDAEWDAEHLSHTPEDFAAPRCRCVRLRAVRARRGPPTPPEPAALGEETFTNAQHAPSLRTRDLLTHRHAALRAPSSPCPSPPLRRLPAPPAPWNSAAPGPCGRALAPGNTPESRWSVPHRLHVIQTHLCRDSEGRIRAPYTGSDADPTLGPRALIHALPAAGLGDRAERSRLPGFDQDPGGLLGPAPDRHTSISACRPPVPRHAAEPDEPRFT